MSPAPSQKRAMNSTPVRRIPSSTEASPLLLETEGDDSDEASSFFSRKIVDSIKRYPGRAISGGARRIPTTPVFGTTPGGGGSFNDHVDDGDASTISPVPSNNTTNSRLHTPSSAWSNDSASSPGMYIQEDEHSYGGDDVQEEEFYEEDEEEEEEEGGYFAAAADSAEKLRRHHVSPTASLASTSSGSLLAVAEDGDNMFAPVSARTPSRIPTPRRRSVLLGTPLRVPVDSESPKMLSIEEKMASMLEDLSIKENLDGNLKSVKKNASRRTTLGPSTANKSAAMRDAEGGSSVFVLTPVRARKRDKQEFGDDVTSVITPVR